MCPSRRLAISQHTQRTFIMLVTDSSGVCILHSKLKFEFKMNNVASQHIVTSLVFSLHNGNHWSIKNCYSMQIHNYFDHLANFLKHNRCDNKRLMWPSKWLKISQHTHRTFIMTVPNFCGLYILTSKQKYESKVNHVASQHIVIILVLPLLK